MGVGAAIPAGFGLGQQAANNPNIGAPSGVQNLFSTMDPLGNAITKMGGDPLNIYGNKNNPNALLFPSNNPNANGVPSVLPSFNIPVAQPGGQFMPVNRGGGMFNAMANQGAGQLYSPGSPNMGQSAQNMLAQLHSAKPGYLSQQNSLPLMAKHSPIDRGR